MEIQETNTITLEGTDPGGEAFNYQAEVLEDNGQVRLVRLISDSPIEPYHVSTQLAGNVTQRTIVDWTRSDISDSSRERMRENMQREGLNQASSINDCLDQLADPSRRQLEVYGRFQQFLDAQGLTNYDVFGCMALSRDFASITSDRGPFNSPYIGTHGLSGFSTIWQDGGSVQGSPLSMYGMDPSVLEQASELESRWMNIVPPINISSFHNFLRDNNPELLQGFSDFFCARTDSPEIRSALMSELRTFFEQEKFLGVPRQASRNNRDYLCRGEEGFEEVQRQAIHDSYNFNEIVDLTRTNLQRGHDFFMGLKTGT